MNIVNKDSKNTFTRMCIGEAIIKLLKDTDFDKIRITSVAKCAGVSRITFYKYYESIHDALCDYLNIIIIEYLEECANHLDKQTGQHQNERTLNEILFFTLQTPYAPSFDQNGHSCPCPILQYDASNRIMLQLCAAGRAVCVILAARFAAVRARRYRAHFRQLVAQRS